MAENRESDNRHDRDAHGTSKTLTLMCPLCPFFFVSISENESVDEKLLLHEAKCRYNHKVALDPVQCERCAAPWIIKECKSKFPNGGCGNPSVLGSCRPLELAGQSPTIDLFRTFSSCGSLFT